MATTMRRWLRVSVAAVSLAGLGGVMAQSLPAVPASSAAAPVTSVTKPRATATASNASASSIGANAVSAPSYVPLESFSLVAQSASEGVAVMRSPDRRLVTLRVGAILAQAKARLVMIQGDSLKFETTDEKGAPQLVWVRRGAKPEDPVQVERVSLAEPVRPRQSQTASVKQAFEPGKNNK